jgi:hypothetical protein
MLLTRHQTPRGPRWAADRQFLPDNFDLRTLLALPREDMPPFSRQLLTGEPAAGPLLAPIENFFRTTLICARCWRCRAKTCRLSADSC